MKFASIHLTLRHCRAVRNLLSLGVGRSKTGIRQHFRAACTARQGVPSTNCAVMFTVPLVEKKPTLYCSYCGGSDYVIRTSHKLSNWEQKRGICVIKPCCSNCLNLIKVGRLPHNANRAEAASISRAFEISRFAAQIDRDSVLDTINDAVNEINTMEREKMSALASFNKAANEAAEGAKKLEFISRCIDSAKVILQEKSQLTYERCRSVANRHIANAAVRHEVFKRDGYKCKTCLSTKMLSVDHIVSIRLGGSNEMSNLQTLCLSCNSRKGAQGGQRGGEKLK